MHPGPRPLIALVLSLLHGAALAQSFCTAVTPESTTAATLLGNGTPGSVSTAQIQAALDAGGVWRFNVGAAPTTIVLGSTLNATRAVVLDGAGVVTLSGGGVRRILTINNPNPAQNAPHFTVTLQHLAFADASVSDGRGAAIYKPHDFEYPHKVSLKLSHCRFSNNLATLDATPQDDGGGAFYGELLERIDIGD